MLDLNAATGGVGILCLGAVRAKEKTQDEPADDELAPRHRTSLVRDPCHIVKLVIIQYLV